MSGQAHGSVPRALAVGLAVFVLFAVAAFGAACGDSTQATTATTMAEVDTAVATVETSATTAQPDTTEATEATVATEASAPAATTSAPDLVLGKDDSQREFRLNVGERVRIELKPYVNDRVKAVAWDYVPIVVQEVDSGTRVIEDVVVECWLELEAVVAGPVTVRATYEYPYGSSRTTWVAYLFVQE